MTIPFPPVMSPDVKALADAIEPSDYVIPPRFPAAERPTIHQDILNFLYHTPLINMSSIDPGNWPATHCMHFVSVGGEDGSLIVYAGTQPHTRKLVNFRSNPRMSIVACKADETKATDRSSYLRLYALTSILTNGEERLSAYQAMCDRPGYESTRALKLGDDPMLRFDVVLALWEDRARGASAGTLDYAAHLRGQ